MIEPVERTRPAPAWTGPASLAALAWVLAVALAGCSGLFPTAAPGRPASTAATASKLAVAEATHEYPGPPPPRQGAPTADSPTAAITRFAHAYINWNAQDVTADMTTLARDSVGQARSELSLTAAETRGDSTLAQGEISNHGTVEAVAARSGHPGQYVVVTRESTVSGVTADYQGLEPARHLALATVVALRPGAWVISAWQPEN